MQMAQAQRLESSWIRSKTVCDDALWLNRLVSQQPLQQRQRRLCVSSALDNEVQTGTCARRRRLLARMHNHLAGRLAIWIDRITIQQCSGHAIRPPKSILKRVADLDPASRQQLFDIAEA